ncbi:hypothetical protein [Peribacillus muralis]|uniref:hypothetical protein n=1 Tax=Peribacillus muralis TaxID=264697 RepID=UPI003CFD99D4
MNKGLVPALLISLFLGLTGCGKNENNPEQAASVITKTEKIPEENDKTELTTKDKADIKEASKPETVEGLGEITPVGFGYNDDLGIDGTDSKSKPQTFDGYEVYVEGFAVSHVKPDEKAMAFFNDSNNFQAILVQIKVKNNKDDTHSNVVYEPSEIKLEVQGEMIYAEPVLSDAFEAIEEGQEQSGMAWFIVKNESPIKSAKLTLPSESGSSHPTEKTYKFDILDIKNSIYKDNHS